MFEEIGLQELKFNSEEMMYDDEENDLLNTYVRLINSLNL